MRHRVQMNHRPTHRFTKPLLGFFAGALLVPLLHAGEAGATREYLAVRTARPPNIDGTPLEPEWMAAPEISDFTQQEPDTGLTPTEKTVVRVLYDDDAIYFAAWLSDSKPVTSRLARRDSYLAADWFAVYIDADHDHRNALMFRVNPAGVVRDAFVEEEDEDRDWNAVWDAAAAVTPEGWTAEIRIPLSQLRFPRQQTHVWGINFQREIARNNEYTRLVHVPRDESGFVSRFAHLIGIEGVSPKRSLEILPYGLLRSSLRGNVRPGDPFNEESSFDADAGVDLKYRLASNLTLTASLNPDFGQVELDPAQINLTEFELFFPERRPFFLEGADLFAFSGPGGNVFYSRRIGRRPQLLPDVPYDFIDVAPETNIAAALKLTGKTGNGWKIAALDAVTREQRAFFSSGGVQDSAVVEPLTNYFVGRVGKEIGSDSGVGMMFTSVHRDNTEESKTLRDQAYTLGIDGYRFWGKRDYALEWAIVGSHIEGSPEAIVLAQRSPVRYYQRTDATHLEVDPSRTSLTGWSGRGTFYKRTGKWRYRFNTAALSPGLEMNDIGFHSRADQWTTSASLVRVDSTPGTRVRFSQLAAAKVYVGNLDNDLLVDRYFITTNITLMNYMQISSALKLEERALDDRATRGGPVAGAPRRWHVNGGFNSDYRKKVVVSAGGQIQRDEIGSWVRWFDGSVEWKPSTNAEVSFAFSHDERFDRRQYVRTVTDAVAPPRYVFGDIKRTTLALATRLDWAFTSKLSFQLYIEPFVASGDYTRFKELDRPRSFDFRVYGDDIGTVEHDVAGKGYLIDPDGAGPAAAFTLRDPDFNFRSLRGNAVLRWEFRPGSTLYFAWNENRDSIERIGDFDASRDFSALTEIPSDDVFLIKVSYWIGM